MTENMNLGKTFLFTSDLELFGDNIGEAAFKWLKLLDEYRVRGTFFVTSRILNEYFSVVQDIINGGHEIASHGYTHPKSEVDISFLPDWHEEDIDRELFLSHQMFLDKGLSVKGYRAPAFRINEIILNHIKKYFSYDSSSVDFIIKGGKYTGIHREIFCANDFAGLPITGIGPLKIPFGSPYLLNAGKRIRWIFHRYLDGLDVIVFYCHVFDMIRLNPSVLATWSPVQQLYYFKRCGSDLAHDFFSSLFRAAIDSGYQFITCSELYDSIRIDRKLKNADRT